MRSATPSKIQSKSLTVLGKLGKLIDDAVNRREAYVKQYEKTLLITDNEILILKTQMKANTDGFEEEY